MLKTPNYNQNKKIYMRVFSSTVIQVEADTQEEADKLLDAKIEQLKANNVESEPVVTVQEPVEDTATEEEDNNN
jgi:hypothetical protein